MSRLVDADALREYYNVTDPAGTFAYCDTILQVIDGQPTIDAIPVEWLVSWINRHPNDLRCVWFVSLEMEWRKKQEDENGRTMETL